ncbi:mechanosensitive ion channel family protein [Candidatus Margulisiibacteriota bacterium]
MKELLPKLQNPDIYLSIFKTRIPVIILIIVISYIAIKTANYFLRLIRKIIQKKLQKESQLASSEIEKRINTLISILASTIKVVIYIVAIMLLLKQLGIDIAPLLAGAGIIGLAIGFGAQELVRDIISGFFILLENQIRENDVAIINGTGGLVEKIGLRTVVLRDLSGVVHIFQNGKINSLSNMTQKWSAMIFDIGIAYKEDPDKAMEIMQKTGDDLKNDKDFKNKILEPIEIFGVDKFADSAVIIKARLKTKPIEQWAVGREYRKRLKLAFDKAGIEIPFPHQTIYWGKEIEPLLVKTKTTI